MSARMGHRRDWKNLYISFLAWLQFEPVNLLGFGVIEKGWEVGGRAPCPGRGPIVIS